MDSESEVTLLVMTDGRGECLESTIGSAFTHLEGDIVRRVIHDDSAVPAYHEWLHDMFPRFEIIKPEGPGKAGFGGAIINAWKHLRNEDPGWIVHLEDDFVFNRIIDLDEIIQVMLNRQDLVQMVIKRQPWNYDEVAAGGFIQLHPEAYHQANRGNAWWIEHEQYFSTNPCLYHNSLMWETWPDGSNSEGLFSRKLLDRYPAAVFGFWGKIEDAPWCEHIGLQRNGIGY